MTFGLSRWVFSTGLSSPVGLLRIVMSLWDFNILAIPSRSRGLSSMTRSLIFFTVTP